jgi:hypothetical protein
VHVELCTELHAAGSVEWPKGLRPIEHGLVGGGSGGEVGGTAFCWAGAG